MGFPSCCILWVFTPRGLKQEETSDTLDQAFPFPLTSVFQSQSGSLAFLPWKNTVDGQLVKQMGLILSIPTNVLWWVLQTSNAAGTNAVSENWDIHHQFCLAAPWHLKAGSVLTTESI